MDFGLSRQTNYMITMSTNNGLAHNRLLKVGNAASVTSSGLTFLKNFNCGSPISPERGIKKQELDILKPFEALPQQQLLIGSCPAYFVCQRPRNIKCATRGISLYP